MEACEYRMQNHCSRFGIPATPTFCKLCRTDPAYRKAWEAGTGPAQLRPLAGEAKPRAVQSASPKPSSGPGTELKSLFRWLGIEDTGCGGCGGMATRMNRWGPAKCRKNLNTIVGHLEEQAAERKLPFSRFAATKLVRLAIWKAERKLRIKVGATRQSEGKSDGSSI